MNNSLEVIVELLKSNGYDFINIFNINYEVDQKGFDTEVIIANKKITSDINIIAVKDHYITNITFSKSYLNQIKNILDFIEKNSYYNKKLSIYYLDTYMKDFDDKKNINIMVTDKICMEKNNEITKEKIEQIYGYKFISIITSNIETKIENINSFKVKRIMKEYYTYTEGLLRNNEEIFFSCNNKINNINLEDRLKFYTNKFTIITNFYGKVKITGYAISILLRQLMNIFNSDAMNSNTTFIKRNHLGKNIFASYIDIIDYPNCPIFKDRTPIDHNGIKTKKKYIVKKGIILESFGDINSNLRNGLASPGNYYKKSSDLTNGLISYRNIILNINKISKIKDYNFEIKEFSLDTFLNLQTGILSGKGYGFQTEIDSNKPIVCNINIDIIKFLNEIESVSENKIYDDIFCPDVVVDYKEVIND